MVEVRAYETADLQAMIDAWNEVVRDGIAFPQLGTIPGGFRMPDGTYADICPYYHEL